MQGEICYGSKRIGTPRILSLHRFMVAIARESLNISENSGSLTDPLVWDWGTRPKTRRIGDRVVVDLAQLPGPPGFLDHTWVTLDGGPLTDEDISCWPFSVPMLVKFKSFLSTLRWPEGLNEMGKFGVSYLEIFILFEKWMGHRLLPEKTVPLRHRSGRPILIGTSPVSERVQIRAGCQFVGGLFRSLNKLPGGLSRFIPGSLGPHLSRLRHLDWLQCGHGLSRRPLESAMPGCLEALLSLLGYPANAIVALSNGTLRIRFCTTPFAGRFPPWELGSGEGLGCFSHSFSPDEDLGHHSPPGEVNDKPRLVRRRLRGKTPVLVVVGRVASPPAKRRKWLSLPGPSREHQESSHFPRVGVG